MRPSRAEDAEAAFAAYTSDPEVTRYLSWRCYTEIEPLREFLRGVARTWETGGGGYYAWMLCLRGTDTPMGSIGVSLDLHGAMLGYVLGRAHWNRGLTTEAVRYVAAWALAQPPLFRVWAVCDTENAASVRVMEKAGRAREDLLRRWYPCPTIAPEPRDCCVYAKVR